MRPGAAGGPQRAVVHAGRPLLERVLRNLIGNAIRGTKAGG